MLTLSKVNQYYGQSHTLWDVDLDIPEGKCSCLMGRNGVGKTTLLQCIMGLQKIRSGEITFEAQHHLEKLSIENRPNLGIGYVPQGRQIFPLLTVEENLQTGLPIRKKGDRKIPDLIYDLFPVLKDIGHRRGGDLSGGQQQQLAIGRAMVINPKLLILDEPTEGIQPNIVQDIGDILIRLNQELGLTVLLVEQKLPFARKVADYFNILERGRIVANGPMDQLDDNLIQAHLSV